ncbi:MAG: cytochrome b/b6 domain-containing protein [Phycisphaerae bacterium]|nr:cytochrome b/b6 domain-containing protein [Phycisphaerae bacterium]
MSARMSTLMLGLMLGWIAQSTPAQEVAPVPAAGEEVTAAPVSVDYPANPTSCADCHADRIALNEPLPPAQMLKDSTHVDLDCTDCHMTISMDDLDFSSANPHGPDVPEVGTETCGECHDEAASVYKMHGRLKVNTDPDMPSCWSCHGAHDVLPTTDRRSHVHPINLPETCESCHTDVNLVKRHEYLREEPIKLYESSVHGQASRKGLYVSATCNDCHSAKDPDGKRTAHRILGAGNPESTIYHFNIPNTCGQCHESVTKDYLEGIHGILVTERGSVDSPVCTTCHGEHGIISPKDPRSPVSSARVAEDTCAPCHESVVLNEKYGIPSGRLRSYIDSYHGLKSKAGDVHVANCASCHGAHRILPSSNPNSSINAANLQHTCGECHPGISAELAKTPIHSTATGLYAGWPEFFRNLYIVLIVGTIGGMLLHNGADWLRFVRNLGKRPFVQRLSMNEVMQHWALMISFTVLVISGFSLRFSEAGWVKLLFGWTGGFEIRGIVHRVAAVILILTSIWHLFYLITPRGWQCVKDISMRIYDLRHLGENIQYFLGRRSHPPGFKRFSYMEKAEYWALVWGTIIMTVTGLLLWFDNFFVQSLGLPKGVLDVALVIHYYEAWLATLAILVWHIYGTMFSPAAYPMNTAWLAGRMPRDMYAHEHPEGPRLKARLFTVRLEDEEEAGSGNYHAPDAEERLRGTATAPDGEDETASASTGEGNTKGDSGRGGGSGGRE